jgi:hypothetical protein
MSARRYSQRQQLIYIEQERITLLAILVQFNLLQAGIKGKI